ncbi:hypothetical protein KKF82_06570 [Patescibacteria group bacterium]|nr:hypothetical protein [Patescibacteria group bacterium]
MVWTPKVNELVDRVVVKEVEGLGECTSICAYPYTIINDISVFGVVKSELSDYIDNGYPSFCVVYNNTIEVENWRDDATKQGIYQDIIKEIDWKIKEIFRSYQNT